MNEATSARAALTLNDMGYRATAVVGGLNAWAKQYPVEPVEHPSEP